MQHSWPVPVAREYACEIGKLGIQIKFCKNVNVISLRNFDHIIYHNRPVIGNSSLKNKSNVK